jgi:WD40 repeat protein
VTIKGVPRPDVTFVKARSRLPTEIEVGKATLDQLLGVAKTKKRSQDSLTRSVVNLTNKRIWRYEVGLPFKIPNKLLYAFDTGNRYIAFYFIRNRGAFSCSFSHNGIYLAIACVGAENYPIKVYDILTGERVATLDGHCDLVYQLSWSDNDE